MKKLDGIPLNKVLYETLTKEVMDHQMLTTRYTISSTVSRFTDPRQERCVTVDQADEITGMIDIFSQASNSLQKDNRDFTVLQNDAKKLRANSLITVINTTEPVHCHECSRSGSCPEEARRTESQK